MQRGKILYPRPEAEAPPYTSTITSRQHAPLPTREGYYSAEGREVARSAVLLGVDISLNLGNDAPSSCCTLESLRKACLPAFLPGEEREQAWAHLLGVSLGDLPVCGYVGSRKENQDRKEQWLQGGSILPSPESGGTWSSGTEDREKVRTKQQLLSPPSGGC